MGDIFDIAEARGALVRRRESLVAECKACHEVRCIESELELRWFVGCLVLVFPPDFSFLLKK